MADIVNRRQVLRRKSDTGHGHATCKKCENSSEGYASDPITAD